MSSEENLCVWYRPDAEAAAAWGVPEDEWLVHGTYEQGASEHVIVNVLARRSGRITRVRLGEEVSYGVFRVAEGLGVVYGGSSSSSNEEQDNWEDYRAERAVFCWHPKNDACTEWLVRGEPGRAGTAVIVVSARTMRQTAVYLTRETGSAGTQGLYEFIKC